MAVRIIVVNPIIIVDTTPPVITVTGGTTSMLVGGVYTQPTVTALDNIDGDITSSIVEAGDTVNPNVAGTYTVTYNVSDESGNAATQKTHTVEVKISTPVIDTIPTQNVFDWGGGLATTLLTVTGTDIHSNAEYTIVGDPTSGALTIGKTTGTLIYDRDINPSQTYSITVKVVNIDDGGEDTETFTLNVTDNL